ncbi:hypothetical protein L484_006270 [Morus notabilis]|uniref:Disease resistance R13L4/SHOC-2-like LRR domain-containing protein n=1 Tax=Morus notabilis TaxID=981085 RepID=W9QPS1_9ROSA|nr:hypothetical protein L484_006270 [Morus notabilis]
MKYLESLVVRSISEDETLDLDSISHPPEFLRCLRLSGPLMTLPRWIMKLQNLAKISIRWSKLGDDPLKVLGNLHELVELDISTDAFVGEQLHFEGGVFPKLKVLRLQSLKWLSSLIIEEGALRDLEKLYLGPTPQMKEVPTGIKHLKNLKFLRFVRMPDEFVSSMNPKEGHSYHIVQHVVPFVFFHCADDQFYRLHDSGLQQLLDYERFFERLSRNYLGSKFRWRLTFPFAILKQYLMEYGCCDRGIYDEIQLLSWQPRDWTGRSGFKHVKDQEKKELESHVTNRSAKEPYGYTKEPWVDYGFDPSPIANYKYLHDHLLSSMRTPTLQVHAQTMINPLSSKDYKGPNGLTHSTTPSLTMSPLPRISLESLISEHHST